MSLFGYISTSEDKDKAYGFAWKNEAEHKKRVVFKIEFKNNNNYYVMDMSSFPDEKEILLADGTPFVVKSIEDVKDNFGNEIKLISLQCDTGGLSLLLSFFCMFFVQPITFLR